MKKQAEQKNKLSFKKFQISKIKNPQVIVGGNAIDDGNGTISDQKVK
jgi:hypothetical protein